MGTTIKLYQHDVYLRECNSLVLSVISDPLEIISLGGKSEAGSVCFVLDQTVFFPEGGGQPCDIGHMNENAVFYVFEKQGIIYHQILINASITSPSSATDEMNLLLGTSIHCKLDWENRFSNMQRHCGEHILSAAFYDLYGGVNRGFHIGCDYMTIDINLEERPEFSQLTDEMMYRVELESNKMIWDNLPVSIRFFEKREDAEQLPMRKALAIDEDIILVCVGDESNPAGCVACCGTHPKTTGEVGLIKIYKWESYKGMTRITFDAGKNALANYLVQHDIVRSLTKRYSTDMSSLMERIQAQEQKNKEIRQELHELKKLYIEERIIEIQETINNPMGDLKGNAKKVIVREYPNLKTDDLLAMGRQLLEYHTNLIALISPAENTVILICGGFNDCGKIIKDNAGVWNGKGGGRADNARALFPSRQDLDCFVDYLQKAY